MDPIGIATSIAGSAVAALTGRVLRRLRIRVPKPRLPVPPPPDLHETEYERITREHREYHKKMERSFHHVFGWYPPMAACGWSGRELYGAREVAALRQMKLEQDALEAVGGTYLGRAPCKWCLARLGV